MSAIKAFFQKKKTDAKFKLAGGGQKLGDSSTANQAPSAGSSRSQPQANSRGNQNRGNLTQQQKLAATAALDR